MTGGLLELSINAPPKDMVLAVEGLGLINAPIPTVVA